MNTAETISTIALVVSTLSLVVSGFNAFRDKAKLKSTLHGSMSSEYLLVYLGALTAARSFQNYLVAKGQARP